MPKSLPQITVKSDLSVSTTFQDEIHVAATYLRLIKVGLILLITHQKNCIAFKISRFVRDGSGEAFCGSDPSTMTCCKHEFHLQCILEWCQRSSQCPMCWQSISLKDPSSQELLDAVEQERNMRMNPPRNTATFHHPALGNFELQHLPVSASDSELEERIIQHLAAAAAMGRARQLARREAMIASSNSPFITLGEDSAQIITPRSSSQADHITTTASGSGAVANQLGTSSSNRRSPAQTSPNSQDRAGPSDFQSFSESLKSRLNALSVRYKESITKSTRGWKERLFAHNSSMPDPGTEVRREVDPDTVELETVEMGGNSHLTEIETPPPCAASSASN
ncbi:unnamed protein product [Fraxinus pennsylvanica]|uniref:RING-type E3 ubiquitin transferase n=1 Tax=Fraxinus pennsylvanica TaxID=56036 RepID=A0AAD2AGP5_9LAMI|nr:unnamed protein product [Fraxinus pennsylvanica]